MSFYCGDCDSENIKSYVVSGSEKKEVKGDDQVFLNVEVKLYCGDCESKNVHIKYVTIKAEI